MLAYLDLPVCLPGSEQDGLPDKIAKLKILPQQIVAYNESYNDDQTMIFLANGQPFLIGLSMIDLESRIAEYWRVVNKHNADLQKAEQLKSKLRTIN